MPVRQNPQTIIHALIYGGASALLVLDLFFLVQAAIQQNFIPIVPIIAGVFLAAGLLFVMYAESQARQEDKLEHRRLSRVAHQLEHPLHVLQEDLAYLVQEAGKLPAEERMKLKRMETKTKVLLENIRDVFLMMRAQQGHISQEQRTYDVCTLVKDAVEQVRALASAKNIEIIQKMHCQEAAVAVDRQLFLLALAHVLENGIHYSLTPGVLNIAVIKGKNQTRVIVQDRGIGVTSEDQPVIFLPFARGEKADQFDPDGIGVGLTLARLIIREFGGTLIWRTRQKRAGSEFEIRLPLAKLRPSST